MGFVHHPEGIRQIGHDGAGFSFDNETPRHRVYLRAFEIADRLVTNREYCEFIEDRGSERPELWLSEGWDVRQTQGWAAPLYWEGDRLYTLHGMRALEPAEPATPGNGPPALMARTRDFVPPPARWASTTVNSW